MPKTTFIVLKSPTELDPTNMIGRLSSREDASVVLIEDGVYQALIGTSAEKLSKAAREVFVSREDLEARGFAFTELKVGKTADYPDIIDLVMEKTERTVTV